MTGVEAIAVGRRLVAAVEMAMMETDPAREPFELLALRFERAEALELLTRTRARAATRKLGGIVPGTFLHAKWLQTNVGANFGG